MGGGNKREIAESQSIGSSGTDWDSWQGKKERERKKEQKRGRKRRNEKARRTSFTKGLAGVFYNATVHRDKELGGNGGSCEGWRGEEEEGSQRRACCTLGVWQGWREKEELLSEYRNTIPSGTGRAGHGGLLQQLPLAVTPVGGTALALPDVLGVEGVL